MFLYVANWKMEMSFNQALEFGKCHYEGFLALSKLPKKRVVICSSFTAIKALYDLFDGTLIELGAQNCSANRKGPYTGQVSAQSLKDIGCGYCIVGHSESRQYLAETNEEIAKKVLMLIQAQIEPVLCIGEHKIDYDAGNTQQVLKQQLIEVFGLIEQTVKPKLYIAYEPVWSIGTGIVPEKAYIEGVCEFILDLAKEKAPNLDVRLLYGGSIDEKTASLIKPIKLLSGFLIGGASLDFKKFEKIVNL